MTTRLRTFTAAIATIMSLGCGPIPNTDVAASADLRPPSLLSVRTAASGRLEILFDEAARIRPEALSINPGLPVRSIRDSAELVELDVDVQEPGKQYTLQATAEDARGNSVSFLADFYGYNPRVPRIVLNELTPRGSAAHPDLLECAVLSDGDMGGVVLYQGVPGGFEDRLIFPSFAVRAGDFILVHFKPAGDSAEINETRDKTASGGIDASDAAFDFWVRDGKGLGGNNGVLALYERPGGRLMDGILYSNGVSAPEKQFRGFGTAQALLWAEGLVADGGWRIDGAEVVPEDAFNPEDSTATRSICRSSDSADTDAAEDWHVVPTRKSSFGAPNSDERYVP